MLWCFLFFFVVPCGSRSWFTLLTARFVFCRFRLPFTNVPGNWRDAYTDPPCMSAALLKQKIQVNLWICVRTTCSSILSVRPYITPIVSTQLHTIYMLAGTPAGLPLKCICTQSRRLYYRRHASARNDRQVSCTRLFYFGTHSTLGNKKMA
jgi:hypothetical protein